MVVLSFAPQKHYKPIMDKSVSIVRVDTRHYRTIAQENWGLTKEQMRGKHVHHRIWVSDGGTNDPSNLYVCSPSFHRWCWHDGETFVEWAIEGGKKGAQKTHEFIHLRKNEEGKSAHAVEAAKELHKVKTEEGKSVHAVNMAKKSHKEKDESGKSVNAVRAAKKSHKVKNTEGKSVLAVNNGRKNSKKLHAKKDEFGRSIVAMGMNEKTHAEKDEKGRSLHAMRRVEEMNKQVWESTEDGFKGNAGNVAKHNKQNGWDPKARVRVK